jgi:hypothetical protein
MVSTGNGVYRWCLGSTVVAVCCVRAHNTLQFEEPKGAVTTVTTCAKEGRTYAPFGAVECR